MGEKSKQVREEPKIVYEDDWLAVLAKPPGWVVNRADSVKGETIQDWIEANIVKLRKTTEVLSEMEDTFVKRSGVAHRLDKDTSGVLLVAKTPQTLEALMNQFKKRTVKKEYVALVHGVVTPSSGSIRLPVGRSQKKRQAFTVKGGGKVSETDYLVEARYAMPENNQWQLEYPQGFSLLRLQPKTGRTHQIRVHMKHIRHPIVGDKTYLGKKRQNMDINWVHRHFLHAAEITFKHPEFDEVSYEVGLPKDLKQSLGYLEPNHG